MIFSFGLSVVTLDSMTNIIKEVHVFSGLPVIADSTELFTLPHLIAKTIADYYQAGAKCRKKEKKNSRINRKKKKIKFFYFRLNIK